MSVCEHLLRYGPDDPLGVLHCACCGIRVREVDLSEEILSLEPDAGFEFSPPRQIFMQTPPPAPTWFGHRWWEGEALDDEVRS